MRSFEARLAEIRRRSDQMLATRSRRRKKLLFTGVPAILCVLVCVAAVLPGLQRSQEVGDSGSPGFPESAVGAAGTLDGFSEEKSQSLNGAGTDPKTGATQNKLTDPPMGYLITEAGQTALRMGGYHWFCENDQGVGNHIIADQADRPLPEKFLEAVIIPEQYAETGSDAGDEMRYPVKLRWPVMPDAVHYTCWPDTVWETANTPAEAVTPLEETGFYAQSGDYVYEITATWADHGTGYGGEVTYYAYIREGKETKKPAGTAEEG